MHYAGGKGRHVNLLCPLIQKYITPETRGYLEVFLGGCNVLPKIICKVRIGNDINRYVVELYQYIQKHGVKDIPNEITEAEYQWAKAYTERGEHGEKDWWAGLCMTQGSFGSQWRGTYRQIERTRQAVASAKALDGMLEGVSLNCGSYADFDPAKFEGWVIYADPPYAGVGDCIYKTHKQGENRSGKFDHRAFWKWCWDMSRNNVVLISEYNMPEPHFVEVERWEYVNTLHRTQRKALIDKVFMVRGGRGAPS